MKSVALGLVLAGILAGQIALCGHERMKLLLAPAAVVLSVAAASSLLGELTWLSVVAGAVSPLALAWLSPYSPALALAVMCALWLSPRLWLARSPQQLAGIGAVSVAAAAVAGVVAARFAAAVALYYFAACVFGGSVLALAAVVLRVNTVVSSSLQSAARLLDGAVRDALLTAAEGHRRGFDAAGRRQNKQSQWQSLLRLVDQRLALRDASQPGSHGAHAELDQKILAQVRGLSASWAETAETAPSNANPAVHEPEKTPLPESEQAADSDRTKPGASTSPPETPSDPATVDAAPAAQSEPDGYRARPLAQPTAPEQSPAELAEPEAQAAPASSDARVSRT
jgi:hypothetical protein